MLEKGVLSYGKSQQDLKQRGRTYGKINLGDAVISAKTEGLRIDINDEFIIHHLKVHQETDFLQWVEQLQQHKLYQNQVSVSLLFLDFTLTICDFLNTTSLFFIASKRWIGVSWDWNTVA